MTQAALATLAIVVATVVGILVRPFRLPEYVFALAGATALLAPGLLPPEAALSAIARGYDVYLFLVGMMLLAEVARQEGLFDWLAAHAARAACFHARHSAGQWLAPSMPCLPRQPRRPPVQRCSH